MNSQLSTFWNLSADQIFVQVQSTPQGLTFILSLPPFSLFFNLSLSVPGSSVDITSNWTLTNFIEIG